MELVETTPTTVGDIVIASYAYQIELHHDLIAAYNYLYKLHLNGYEIDREDWDDSYLVESDTVAL